MRFTNLIQICAKGTQTAIESSIMASIRGMQTLVGDSTDFMNNKANLQRTHSNSYGRLSHMDIDLSNKLLTCQLATKNQILSAVHEFYGEFFKLPQMSERTIKNHIVKGDLIEKTDFYTGLPISKGQSSIEHILPQSSVQGYYPIVRDMHGLRTASVKANAVRSNYPFGDADTQESFFEKGFFYVRNDVKGEIARGLLHLYTANTQYLKLINYDFDGMGKIEMLVDWCLKFPPTLKERRRNDIIYNLQGTLNLFIINEDICKAISTETFIE